MRKTAEGRGQTAEERRQKTDNRKICLLASVFCLLSFPVWGKGPFAVLPPETIEVQAGATATARAVIEVPEGHYIYKDKTDLRFLNLEEIRVKKIVFPDPVKHIDPFFHKTVEIYRGSVPIDVTFEVPESASGERRLESILELQGCSEKLCYPLKEQPVTWDFKILSGAGKATQIVPFQGEQIVEKNILNLLKQKDFSSVLSVGWGWAVLIVFLGGILTSFTPCVLPLVPVFLLIVGVGAENRWRKNLELSLFLVAGLILVYAFLGVTAVALGKTFGFIFQSQWFLLGLAGLFFLFSLVMFGLIPFDLPRFLKEPLSRLGGRGKKGAFFAGAALGLLASPCVGPVLGPLLVFVASTQNYGIGFALLCIYGFGMGLLLLVLGTGYGTLRGRLRAGRFTLWVKYLIGLLLLGASIFYFNAVIPLDRFFSASSDENRVHWIETETQALEIAENQGKPIIIDFYADWCPPCKELELRFFRRADVRPLLDQMVPWRVDATISTEEVERLIQKYNVVGWPTILFLDAEGNGLPEYSVVSYNPEELLENMKQVVERSSSHVQP